ncbi:MAG: hypothetical protein WC852_02705 [Candidatus Nanoarchaeia archaeon]|jgi:hypothetical protein
MKTLTKILGVGGLVAALGSGCEKRDVSAVGETIVVTKPGGCEIVKEFTRNPDDQVYNMVCEENGKNVYYDRRFADEKWTRVIFEDGNVYSENPQGGQ